MKLSKFWKETFLFSFFIFFISSFYQYLRFGRLNLYLANKSLATTALILVGFSFALSGLTYFTPFFKNKLAYRKQLGVTGFITGLFHGFISLFFLSNLFPFPNYFLSNPTPFVFSFLTVVLFTIMTIVSNFNIPQKIGAQNWRRILRTGYIGIVFLIFHFGILSFSSWQSWLESPSFTFPPSSLVLLIFALFVLILRLGLYLKLRK